MQRAVVFMVILALPALVLEAQTQKPISLTHVAVTAGSSFAPAGGGLNGDVSIPREAIQAALKLLGVPYVPGGISRTGLDCSGLVYRVLQDTAGMDVPRGVGGLFGLGTAVTYPMHIGDLVFFDTASEGSPSVPCHVGIYAGSGRFIHAASEGSHTGVIVSQLASPYYHDRFLGARRVIPWRPPVLKVVLTDIAAEAVTASPFPSNEKMTIEVLNRMTGGGPMDLSVVKDGKQMLTTRIAPSDFGPAVIPLVPDAGTWEIRVNRLWKGRELARMTFTVEE